MNGEDGCEDDSRIPDGELLESLLHIHSTRNDENSKSSILCAVLNSDIGYLAIAKCVS